MGDKGGNTYAADTAAQIAYQMFTESEPLRSQIIGRGERFLGDEGAFDVTQSPMWAPGKAAAEDVYSAAQEGILANLPRGGALQESLAETERGKARTLTDLAGQIAMDEYNKAYGLATLTPQQSLAGLSSLAGSEAMAQATEQAAGLGLIGSLFGAGGRIIAAGK